jgi:hypothetical protein
MKRTNSPINREIQTFLDAYGRALSAGDGAHIATMWSVPALVLSDAGAHAVASLDEVAAFFAAAAAQYKERGIVETRPELIFVERVSERILLINVRWPGLDVGGKQVAEEETLYTLMLGDDGQPKIRVAIVRGGPSAS